MNQHESEPQNVLWLISFSLASWLFFSLAFMHQKIFDFIYKLQSNEKYLSSLFNEKEIPMIVENPKTNKKEKENIEKVYRSEKSSRAQGKLTKKKRFRWLSEEDQLKIRKWQQHLNKQREAQQEEILTTRIIKETDLLWKHFQKKRRYSELTKIPASYDFDYHRAFSWDRDGIPQIPTYFYKHYDYIKSMINKIRYHWAPPGGSPRNLYQNSFHSSSYVPGYIRIRVFPPQSIALTFMLDQSGEVLDVRIESSMGYQTLNESFIDAIRSVQNFGVPPKDFMRLNRAFFPWIFRLY